MKTYHFLPVFILLIVSYVGLHYYAGRWLARAFALAPAPAQWLRFALLGLAFFSPLTMFLKRLWHSPALNWLYSAGYAWMGIILVAAFLFACSDLAALALRKYPWFKPQPFAWLTLLLVCGVTAWAVYNGQRTPCVKEVEVRFKDLPPALEGLRIAQISDMHVDSDWKMRQYGKVVETINSAGPDLVLVTGDLLDPGITCMPEMEELTAGMKPRLGVFGSLGNHEYYYGLENSVECFKSFGIRLLKNEAHELKDLRLVGLADIHTEHMTREDVSGLLGKFKDGKFTVIMSHQPVFYPEMAAAGDYLVFSGHTHKGQIFPFHVFTWLFYKYFYGLYRINNSVFYVTSGSGTWGPPLRWLAPAEIPVLTLRKG